MSFVAGFVTGLTAGEAAERRKGRSHFAEYMERRGYTIIDRTGRQIPLETVVNEALQTKQNSGKTILVAGVVLVAAVVATGGSAWLLLSVV